MRRFLNFAMRGRVHAICASTLALFLSLAFLPASGISAGMIGLVTLRYGPKEGAFLLAWTFALGAALSTLLFQSLSIVVVIGAALALPSYLLSAVLRSSSSQGTTLAATGALGALAFLSIGLLSSDPVAWWRDVVAGMLMFDFDEALVREQFDPAMLEALGELNRLVDLVAYASYFSVWSMIFALAVVLLARWWHALLDNPGGFGREFRGLRMDRRIAYLTVGLGVLALFDGAMGGGLVAILFRLVLTLYAVQGLAVAHSWVVHRNASRAWLVAIYVLLLMPLPIGVLGLAVAGFSDAWLDYRPRWQPST